MSLINKYRALQTSTLFLLVVLIIPITGDRVIVGATPHFVYTRCLDTAGSYTPQSLFQSNLNSLLSDLVNASQPSYSDGVGVSPGDVARGLFYCRGDVAPEDCRGCVQAAAARVVLDCPSAKQAVIWFEECTLRYSGQADAVGEDVWACEQAPTTNTVAITADVYGRLFDGLIKEAAYNGSPSMSRYFTTGQTTVAPGVSLEGVVQCAPQMIESECEACLRNTVEVIPTCCGWQREWVAVFRPSCLVQYRYAYAVPATQDSSASSSSSSSSSSVLVPNAHSFLGYVKYFGILAAGSAFLTFMYHLVNRKIKHVLQLVPRWPLPPHPKDPKLKGGSKSEEKKEEKEEKESKEAPKPACECPNHKCVPCNVPNECRGHQQCQQGPNVVYVPSHWGYPANYHQGHQPPSMFAICEC